MQEEVTRKTIALAIKTAKLDGKVLQAALRKLLQLYRKARDTPHRGKQTLKQLTTLQPQSERSKRRRRWVGLHENRAGVKFPWSCASSRPFCHSLL